MSIGSSESQFDANAVDTQCFELFYSLRKLNLENFISDTMYYPGDFGCTHDAQCQAGGETNVRCTAYGRCMCLSHLLAHEGRCGKFHTNQYHSHLLRHGLDFKFLHFLIYCFQPKAKVASFAIKAKLYRIHSSAESEFKRSRLH